MEFQQLTKCAACLDMVEGAARLDCGHAYCSSCLARFVEASLGDVSLFPPTCCRTEIPSSLVAEHVSDATAQVFSARLADRAGGTTGGEGDAGDDQLDALARRAGWRRCPNCHRMVERTVGCNEMSCFCGRIFCYGCGQSYRDCTCGESDPDVEDDVPTDDDEGNDTFVVDMGEELRRRAELLEEEQQDDNPDPPGRVRRRSI